MIRRLLALIAACTLISASLAGEPKGAGAAVAEAQRQLLELDRAWTDAENRHDAQTLRRILDDGFISTFGAGQARNKDAFIAAVVAGDVDPTQSQDLTDRTVRVDRDTAVVVETDTLRGTAEGKLYTHVYRITVTYIRRGGRWVALAEHGVELPPAR